MCVAVKSLDVAQASHKQIQRHFLALKLAPARMKSWPEQQTAGITRADTLCDDKEVKCLISSGKFGWEGA